jgi:hypothetical protein
MSEDCTNNEVAPWSLTLHPRIPLFYLGWLVNYSSLEGEPQLSNLAAADSMWNAPQQADFKTNRARDNAMDVPN